MVKGIVSFRGRLTLFFLLIVVLPMIAVAVLVTQVTSQSGSGKADARLAAGLETALSVYRDDAGQAKQALRQGDSAALATALRSGDRARISRVTRSLAHGNGITAMLVLDANGHRVAAVGGPRLVAGYRLNLKDPSGSLGSITASTTTPSEYIAQVAHLTGPKNDVALLSAGAPIASTVPMSGASLPASGHTANVDVAGRKLRAGTTDLPGAAGLQLVLLGPRESGGFIGSSPVVAAILVVFFAVAVVFVVMLLRTLGGQAAAMLDAARGIGEGDFTRKVPVVGRDEMAGLASEFNKMSDRLSDQMKELRRQQVEIDHSVRRIGEAFASGLDRQKTLQMVAETALGACGAEYGTIALSGREGAESEAGEPTGPIQDVAVAAEGEALRHDDLISFEDEGVCALASPLRRLGEQPENVGVMTVARHGEGFTSGERDVFLYLAGQVSASIENIALHEKVSEEAVTDELTGLSNNRRFRELISKETARAQRFGHELSLIMLDIDDFKSINDTYGHLQGDEVLRMIGLVLDAESRGVDEPARYGGEEFAVALPETSLYGAIELAERVRVRIEAEGVPRTDRSGTIKVTASVGAATMPYSADGVESLIEAADTALYEAKRAGKNRVVDAPAASPAARS